MVNEMIVKTIPEGQLDTWLFKRGWSKTNSDDMFVWLDPDGRQCTKLEAHFVARNAINERKDKINQRFWMGVAAGFGIWFAVMAFIGAN